MKGRPQASDLLVPSAGSSRDLGEEESGVRERSAREREAEGRAIQVQLERECGALVQGLEGVRFAFHGRVGPEARTLKGHAQALAHVRDGFMQVLGSVGAAPRFLHERSAFVEYLRGLAAFCHATLEAIGEHARSLDPQGKSPRGMELSFHVELAKNLHFDELEDEVGAELHEAGAYDPAVDAVRAAMDRLFHVARALENRL